jgi:hypothetical protein
LTHVLEHRPLVPNKKTHLAVVSTGTDLLLFVDGELAQSKNMADDPPARVITPLELAYYFVGSMDEIRISNVARYTGKFSPAIRLQPDGSTLALYHCDEGNGDTLKDASGNGRDAKLHSVKWIPISTKSTRAAAGIRNPQPGGSNAAAGHALEFNGKDSYVNLPLRYDGTHPLTLEGTILPYSLDNRGGILNDGVDRGFRIIFPMARDAQWPSKGMFIVKTSTGSWQAFLTRDTVVPQQKIRLAAVLEGSRGWLFVDGKLHNANDFQGDYVPATRTILMGDCPDAKLDHHFLGLIDEVRISKIARYKSDYSPLDRFESDADTFALYHFDEGEGEVLSDASGNSHHAKIFNGKWVPGIAGGPDGTLRLLPARSK